MSSARFASQQRHVSTRPDFGYESVRFWQAEPSTGLELSLQYLKAPVVITQPTINITDCKKLNYNQNYFAFINH